MSLSAVVQPVRIVSLRATAVAALRRGSKPTRVRAATRPTVPIAMASSTLAENPLACWSFGRKPSGEAHVNDVAARTELRSGWDCRRGLSMDDFGGLSFLSLPRPCLYLQSHHFKMSASDNT